MKPRERSTENYEDALFNLLMNEFAEQEGLRLLAENERLKAAGNIPEETDRRCRDTIRRELSKRRRRAMRDTAFRTAKTAACILIYLTVLWWGLTAVKTLDGETAGGRIAAAENPDGSQYYAAIRDALAAYGLDGVPVPLWYPQDVEMEGLDVYNNNFSIMFYASFGNENGKSLFFSAAYDWEDHGRRRDTPEAAEAYTSGTKTFHILTNGDTLSAVWAEDQICITIEGNLTVEEVKAMIDSMQLDS